MDAEESGKTYSWKVTARNEFGKETTSDEYSFTTQENRAPSAPSTPSNPGPSDKTTNQPLTVVLSWTCNDPDGDALTYDVYFDTSNNPTTKVSVGKIGKTLNRSNLSIGTTYYWKVVAKDIKGATTEGPVWRFTTQSNRAPNVPSNPSPSNNATNQPLTITLSWECSDPDGDELEYELYYGIEGEVKRRIVTKQKEHLVIGFVPNKTYEWNIIAKDAYGGTSESQTYTFNTLDSRPPEKPQAISPKDRTSNLKIDSVTLKWKSSDPDGDKLSYIVYFGTDRNELTVKGTTEKEELVIGNLEYKKTYYWIVVATDLYGKTAESQIFEFTTKSNILTTTFMWIGVVASVLVVGYLLLCLLYYIF